MEYPQSDILFWMGNNVAGRCAKTAKRFVRLNFLLTIRGALRDTVVV